MSTRRNKTHLERLLEKGVNIPTPESVEIGEEVDPSRIAGESVVLHSGTKIFGAKTLILPNTTLGYEAPVTVDNCRIGTGVTLKGGFFKDAVFLEGSSAGSGSHVREGTIFEEQANIAHTVGLKQTILFPFVTLGSLINFCDVFMAGGTSRKNHSEVGSSYIHFNFTPSQDKATASLIGDVPKGVMLDQPPIFLGGQGGLVGPARLAFGTTIAAGSIYRKDELRPGRLLFEGSGPKRGSIPFVPGYYRSVKRIVVNNLVYIANLLALNQWYRNVRRQFISEAFPAELHEGIVETLQVAIAERIRRLEEFADKMTESIQLYQKTAGSNASERLIRQKEELTNRWSDLRSLLETGMDEGKAFPEKNEFLETIAQDVRRHGTDYLRVIQSIDATNAELGTRWLRQIVDLTLQDAMSMLPAFGSLKDA